MSIYSNADGLVLTMAVSSEVSLRDQVERYVSRLRHAHPFPCDPLECYFGCLPASMQTMSKQGIFGPTPPPPGRALNLLLTMKRPEFKRARNILHVSVDSESTYTAALAGRTGNELVFWLNVDPTVPVPQESIANPFYLPLDHPYRVEIKRWMAGAHQIDKEIRKVMEITERAARGATTTAIVLACWPELANFINTKQKKAKPASHAVVRMWEHVSQEDRELVTYHLAKATMLPEGDKPLTAWIDFYSTDGSST